MLEEGQTRDLLQLSFNGLDGEPGESCAGVNGCLLSGGEPRPSERVEVVSEWARPWLA